MLVRSFLAVAQGQCQLLGASSKTQGEARILGVGVWASDMIQFLQDGAPIVPLAVLLTGE